MPVTRARRPISDFERDARKYSLLLLALQRATSEIRSVEQGGQLGMDQVLERLLPDLTKALNAVQAFVAVLREEQGYDKWFELTAVYPKKELQGYRLPCSGILQQIVNDGCSRVIDSFEQPSAPIPGLELFRATSAVVAVLQTAGHVRVVGICNKANPDLGLFLAADRMALDYLVELVAIGARVGERRSQELKQIQKTSAAISAELDASELLPAIVNGAADIFGAPAVSLMLWDEAEENLVIKASYGLSDEYFKQQCVPKDKVLAAIPSAGEPRPIVTSDLRVTPFGRRDLVERELLCSVLTAPLLASHKMIGILNVYSRGKPRQFSPDEVELAEILANQAAIAIQNARLRQRELTGLQVTSAAINSTLDMRVLLPLVTQKAGEVFDASAISLMLWDEAKEHLIVQASCGLSDEYTRRQRIPKERINAFANTLGGFKPVVISDANLDHLGESALYRQEHIRTVLSAPLVVSSQLVGILNIYSKEQSRHFSPDEKELAAIFANQAAIAIQNATLYSTLEETEEYLNGLVTSSFDAVIAIDKDDRVTVFNKQAEGMFGYSADEMRGDSVAKLHRDVGEARKIHDMISESGAISGYETVLQDRAGKLIPVSLSAISVKDAKGKEIGQAGFMHDLRQIRSLEDRLRVLVEVGRIISGTLDLEQVYQLVVRAAFAAFPAAQKGALHLRDSKTGLLRIKASFGYSPEVIQAATLKVGEGVAGWVFEHATSRIVGNVHLDPTFKKIDHPEAQEQKSIICVPLTVSGSVIGTLSLDSVVSFNAFGPGDLGNLTTLANQAATAIENARLYGTARRRMEELDRLRTIGQTIVELVTERPKEVLEQIAIGACQVIGADSAVIYPYLAAKGTYDVKNIGAHGLRVPKEFDAAKRRSELTSMSGIALDEKLVIVDDVSSGFDRSHRHKIQVGKGKFLEREGIMSFVGISLVVEEEPLGVLFVSFKAPHQFAGDELSIISILANQTAVAIKQARLFDQVNQELKRQKKERAATQAVARLLGTVFDPKAVWQEILKGAMRITKAGRGQVMLWNKGQGRLSLAVSQGLTEREQAQLEALLAERQGMTDWLMRHRQAVLVEDLPHDSATSWYTPSKLATRSVLVAPIFQEHFLTGVIILESRRVAAFKQDDRRLVENLAMYAGMAIHNAMQYEEIRQNALLREGLLEAGRGITALKRPQEVLQAIADSVKGALACDVVTLYTYSQDSAEIGFPVFVSGELHSPAQLQEMKSIKTESVLGQLVASGRPHFADDAARDPLMTAGLFVHREAICSSGGIPLRVGQETLGILFVNYRTPHSFASQEQAEIGLFATQAAIAIYNARLYNDLQRRSRHQEALYEASKAITAGFSLERKRVLDSIVEQAVRHITGVEGRKATSGAIQLYDEDADELVFESIYPQDELPVLKSRLGARRSLDRAKAPNGQIGITGRAVRERKPQHAKDVQLDPDYVEYDPATRSKLDVPLLDGDKVIGVLNVESDQVGAFDEDDELALKGLAELAVIGIKNAEQAEQLSRTNALAVMGAWGADVVHDVNREVGAIRRITFALQQQPGLPAHVKDELQKVDACADSLALPELPEEPLQTGHILEFRDAPSLDLVIGAEVEHLQRAHSSASIKLEPGAAGIQVAMHELWLRRLLRHLVNNAIQATSDKTTCVVTVRTLVQGMVAEVQVEDTGRGVQPEIEATLFRREVPHRDRRPGRGLLLVDFLARQHGGQARLHWNRPGEGACFAFTIPMAKSQEVK